MLQKILKESYNKNRNVAVSHAFLGDMYEKLDNNLRAHAEYTLAEQILNNFYGSRKLSSSEAADIYAKLAILNTKLADHLTAQKYLTKLQKEFGYKHPKTIKVTDYFVAQNLPVGY